MPCAISVVWPAQTVVVENVRFQVLTPTLIRISHDNGSGFTAERGVDGVSLDFPPCPVVVNRQPEATTIVTEAIRLSYVPDEAGGAGSFRLALPGAAAGAEATDLFHIDTQNLGGVVPDLDRCDGWRRHTSYDLGADARPVVMPRGLLSRGGQSFRSKTACCNIRTRFLVERRSGRFLPTRFCSRTAIATRRRCTISSGLPVRSRCSHAGRSERGTRGSSRSDPWNTASTSSGSAPNSCPSTSSCAT